MAEHDETPAVVTETGDATTAGPPLALDAPEPATGDRVQTAIAFVRANPALTIAGGVVVGLAMGALLPRRSRGTVAGQAAKLAEVAGAALAAFGRHAADEAADASASAYDRGANLADRAQKFSLRTAAQASIMGALAARRAGKASDIAADKIGEFSHSAARRLARAEKRAARHLAAAGQVAAKKGGELGDAAGKHLGEAGTMTLSGLAALLTHLGSAMENAGKHVGDAGGDLRSKSHD